MKYPIGQQDFASLREEGKVYVDKTDLIYNLTQNYNYVFLSRPRRFGKSLLLSTIQAYFEGRKELFEGLALSSLEKEWKKHPVLHLELSRITKNNPNSLSSALIQQFEIWEKQYEVSESGHDLGARFANIIISASQKTGERVVILIDEYDNPLINNLHDDNLLENNRTILKAVYSNIKALDRYIRFGMLTGVSRFSKMTIFSGLNNLFDISFSNKYSSICGITEKEISETLYEGVKTLAVESDISNDEALSKLKKWYDGYHFAEKCPDLYNPFSLLCALANGRISDYWLETATPEFLVKKLIETYEPLSNVFNGTVEENELKAVDTSFSSPVALLYQTGYLTIKSYDRENDTYKVGVPNREVENGFIPRLLGDFTGYSQGTVKKEALYIRETMETGDIEEFLRLLTIFLGSIPYDIIPKVSERYFQNTLYLLFRVMGLEVETERRTSLGRSDVIVKTEKYIYIFELKLDGDAEKALSQIEEKNYALPFIHDGRKIIKVGLNFSSVSRSLESYKYNY